MPDDWPGCIDLVRVESEYLVTDRICEECNGTRSAITHVFRINDLIVKLDGQKVSWSVFCAKYPLSGALFSEFFQIGKLVHPTCTACQEDMTMRAKDFYDQHMKGHEDSTADVCDS